jgi:hypothetical protein
MSKLDVLPTPPSIDLVSPPHISPIFCPPSQNLPWSQSNSSLFNDKLASLEMGTLHDDDVDDDGDIIFPGLPPLLRGHPDMHLRDGVIRAACLSAAGAPDAEKAYFVADLSYVYNQYERWQRNLPEIEPFYGARARHAQPSYPSLTCMRVWP